VSTVTDWRLTAIDTPIQITHRKAKRASSGAPKIEKPSTWRVKTLPASDSTARAAATTTTTRAIPMTA
jgi:hypothetical protein